MSFCSLRSHIRTEKIAIEFPKDSYYNLCVQNPFNLRIFLLVAIAIGCILRFVNLGAMEFKADEYNALVLAEKHAENPFAVSYGLRSSVGLFNPPFFIFYLSSGLVLTKSPVVIVGSIALLNVVGIVLLYFFSMQHFGKRTALWITALLATSPWAILHARKLWAQDLLFPFLIAFYVVLFYKSDRYPYVRIPLAFILITLASQLHLSVWFLLPIFAVYLVQQRARFSKGPVAVGLVIALLIYLPYLLILDDSWQFIEIAASDTSRLQGLIQHLLWFVSVPVGHGLELYLGEEGMQVMRERYFLGLSLSLLLATALLHGVAFLRMTYLQVKQSLEAIPRFFVYVTLFVLFCYVVLNVPAFPHYMIVLLPILTIFFVQMCESWGRAARAVLIVIVLAQLHVSAAFVHYVGHENAVMTGEYGVPFKHEENTLRQQWETVFPSGQ